MSVIFTADGTIMRGTLGHAISVSLSTVEYSTAPVVMSLT
jgi:hypothetical protein